MNLPKKNFTAVAMTFIAGWKHADAITFTVLASFHTCFWYKAATQSSDCFAACVSLSCIWIIQNVIIKHWIGPRSVHHREFGEHSKQYSMYRTINPETACVTYTEDREHKVLKCVVKLRRFRLLVGVLNIGDNMLLQELSKVFVELDTKHSEKQFKHWQWLK